jgi:hypothetical protein
VTLPEHLLAVLGESPLPVPTADLVALTAAGKSHPRNRVWAALRNLLRAGLVRRDTAVRPRCNGRPQPVTLWRLAP